MRREEVAISNNNSPLIAYWRVVNNQFIDEISGTPHVRNSNSNFRISGDYVYMSNKGSIDVGFPVNGTFKSIYMNTKTSWAGSTPNPPTNGVSPSWFNGKIRIEVEFYEPSSDLLKNIFCNMSHNRPDYRGTCLVRSDANTYSWREHYTSYWRPPGWSEEFTTTSGYSANDPLRMVLDLTEDYYRISFYNISGTKLYDSGVRHCLSQSSSYRQTAYMHSNWSSETVAVYVKYHKVYDGSLLDDFGV